MYEPEDEAEVVRLMQKAIGEGWRLRVCGSGISPNALSFSPERMVCMANMAKVLHVDVDAKQARRCRCCSARSSPPPQLAAAVAARQRAQARHAPLPIGDEHTNTQAGAQVRVQAGARVSDVVEALRPHGLTLQNYASVREQQIGGFTQVSAHGTGAELPPVDEQARALVSMLAAFRLTVEQALALSAR